LITNSIKLIAIRNILTATSCPTAWRSAAWTGFFQKAFYTQTKKSI
jgi:hypothetical protein